MCQRRRSQSTGVCMRVISRHDSQREFGFVFCEQSKKEVYFRSSEQNETILPGDLTKFEIVQDMINPDKLKATNIQVLERQDSNKTYDGIVMRLAKTNRNRFGFVRDTKTGNEYFFLFSDYTGSSELKQGDLVSFEVVMDLNKLPSKKKKAIRMQKVKDAVEPTSPITVPAASPVNWQRLLLHQTHPHLGTVIRKKVESSQLTPLTWQRIGTGFTPPVESLTRDSVDTSGSTADSPLHFSFDSDIEENLKWLLADEEMVEDEMQASPTSVSGGVDEEVAVSSPCSSTSSLPDARDEEQVWGEWHESGGMGSLKEYQRRHEYETLKLANNSPTSVMSAHTQATTRLKPASVFSVSGFDGSTSSPALSSSKGNLEIGRRVKVKDDHHESEWKEGVVTQVIPWLEVRPLGWDSGYEWDVVDICV